jgi:ParB family chromosome partitioning protein
VGHGAVRIPLDLIDPNPRNPRQRESVDELAASLNAYGLLQPVIVRPKDARYELIAGHRRVAAARKLGWSEIDALVREESDDLDAYVLTLTENLQREDLSPREEAAALEVLVRERGWTTREVAEAIKRSQSFVSRRLRVFEDDILAPLVLTNRLPVSTAEVLLAVPPEGRRDLAERAVAGGWGQQETRRAVAEFQARRSQAAEATGREGEQLSQTRHNMMRNASTSVNYAGQRPLAGGLVVEGVPVQAGQPEREMVSDQGGLEIELRSGVLEQLVADVAPAPVAGEGATRRVAELTSLARQLTAGLRSAVLQGDEELHRALEELAGVLRRLGFHGRSVDA